MIRGILFLLIAIIAVTFLRMVIGLVMRSMSQALAPEKAEGRGREAIRGELKRDPICGTYVAASASIKKTVGKEVVHFCSPTCRDRYKG
jgi:YHS domain-containing protein